MKETIWESQIHRHKAGHFNENKNEVTMQHFVSLVSPLQPTDSTLLEAHGLEIKICDNTDMQTHVNDSL